MKQIFVEDKPMLSQSMLPARRDGLIATQSSGQLPKGPLLSNVTASGL
jgi:hypothetical protein